VHQPPYLTRRNAIARARQTWCGSKFIEKGGSPVADSRAMRTPPPRSTLITFSSRKLWGNWAKRSPKATKCFMHAAPFSRPGSGGIYVSWQVEVARRTLPKIEGPIPRYFLYHPAGTLISSRHGVGRPCGVRGVTWKCGLNRPLT
jgi:hypothetical protein